MLRLPLVLAAAACLSGCALLHRSDVSVVAAGRTAFVVDQPDLIALVEHDSVRVDTLFEGGFSSLFAVGDTLFAVTDRGPSVSAAARSGTGGPARVFPLPDYTPTLYRIGLGSAGQTSADDPHLRWQAQLLDPVPLRNAGGELVSGRPVSVYNAGAGGVEVAWADTAGTLLQPDPSGLHIEGAAEGRPAVPPRMGVPGRPATFWVADAYRPALLEIDRETGRTFRRFTARLADAAFDQPLDEVLTHRKPGQGFAGLARLDDGRLIAAMRAPLPIPDAASTAHSRYVRLVVFDAISGSSTTLAYELGGPGHTIGDLARAQGSRVLVLEHDPEGKSWVYAVDLSGGTLVLPSYSGSTMEQLAGPEAAETVGLVPVPKTLVLDLAKSGWDPALGPPEGIVALTPRLLVAVNDNGYGLRAEREDGSYTVAQQPTVFYSFRMSSSLWYEGTARLPLRERDLEVREGASPAGEANPEVAPQAP